MAVQLEMQGHKGTKVVPLVDELEDAQDAAQHEYPDSEDEMLALHDVRRGLMEQRSRAKNSFMREEGDPTTGYGRVRGRLMMPTDLDKWSRDQKRADILGESSIQADAERSAEIREFVAFGGAGAQRTRFTQANRRTQDQAIAGNDNTLGLLLSLQRPLVETSSMHSAFSALQQHVNESDALLEATLKAHQGHHHHDSVLPSGLPTPSREEFSLLWTPTEEAQLSSDSKNVPNSISGFSLTGESWSQGLHTPNFDATSETVAIVLPSSGVTTAAANPALRNTTLASNTYLPQELHEAINSSLDVRPTSGYYSAEDD